MKNRLLFAALAAAALAATLVAETPAPSQGRHQHMGGGPPAYDVAAETTLSGRVADVLPQSCACGGIHLRLTTDAGDVEVGLGPATFLGELGAQFAVGDTLSVVGSKPKNEAPAEFLARTVTKGEATYELRDAAGAPRWAEQGMGCPMHRRGAKAS